MNNPKQNFFLTKNNQKIHYEFINNKSLTTIIFLHGLMSNIQSKKAKHLKKFVNKNKINLLLFEYSGHGKSSGKFTDFSIKNWVNDSRSIIKKLIKKNKIVLVGSSMGAWIGVILIKYFYQRIKGYVGIASAPDFTEELIWKKLNISEKNNIKKNRIYKLKSNHNNFYPITKKFIIDGKKNLILNKKIKCNFPVELLHGINDSSVPWFYSLKLLKTLISKKINLTIINDGDHSLSRTQDLKKLDLAIKNII
ncbi:MAG: alpha/beta hydrolase [Candidatus Fonsibacter lacus]|jgi:esterase/lipase|uniref:Alpha/beta hydrolase n=2 Tax=Candidatus Fonsibacter lacus TaxID=2576439 RepID=A0A966HKZ8_9PROT|nr:alpha/beta hydrolase [Candidatus Fonsibacter lacus]NCU50722.1 alpha/beta hydrolase [Candidatus Fonsibacter lacus]